MICTICRNIRDIGKCGEGYRNGVTYLIFPIFSKVFLVADISDNWWLAKVHHPSQSIKTAPELHRTTVAMVCQSEIASTANTRR